MLVVGLVSEVSPSLGAIFASAPTGTRYHYIYIEWKEGLERQKAVHDLLLQYTRLLWFNGIFIMY